jgi:hypothetical protein
MIDELKAIAIQFAMDIDLGLIDLKIALEEIRKDKETWIPLLEIMEECCDLTRNALDRLYLESRYQRSLF